MEPIKQKMQNARRHRTVIQQGGAAAMASRHEADVGQPQRGDRRFFIRKGHIFAFLLGMSVTSACLIFAWWHITDANFDAPGQAYLTSPAAGFASDPAKTANIAASTNNLVEVITDLSSRLALMTDSLSHLESKLIRAHVITDSIVSTEQKLTSLTATDRTLIAEPAKIAETLPPPAAGKSRSNGETAVTRQEEAPSTTTPAPEGAAQLALEDLPDDAMGLEDTGVMPESASAPVPLTHTPSAELTEKRKGVDVAAHGTTVSHGGGRQSPPGNAGSGGWAINLVSSPSKSEADRFMAKAWSLGIDTEQQHAMVKGKEYWRIRITGFSTLAEAQARAVTVRDKLGLDEVWFVRP